MLLFLSKDDLTLRLKAIHNKDYSVVKTFKTGPSGLVFVLFKSIVSENAKTLGATMPHTQRISLGIQYIIPVL